MRAVAVFPKTREVKVIEHEEPKITTPTQVKLHTLEVGGCGTWDFVSPGHGDVDFESLIRVLNRTSYTGPLPCAWEDSGMDREWGAQDALAFVRRINFSPSTVSPFK